MQDNPGADNLSRVAASPDSPYRDPEMVYPRITGVKVIPRLSPGYQILKVMDNARSAYVLQCTVQSRPAAGLSASLALDEALLSAAL